MLQRLRIRHFATVESIELEFGSGLTVLTGETGAGKSILFDALDLLFGARADAGMVRAGAERCELEALVQLAPDSAASRWLSEEELQDPDEGQQLLLRRVLNADGGSKAWVNGQQVTLSTLRTLAESVLDIHGQHAHQALLRPAEQREWVDAFGHLAAQRQAMKSAWMTLQARRKELQTLDSAAFSDPAQRELLEYQCAELSEFAPEAGEFENLSAEFLRLNRVDELRADCAQALELLQDEDGGVESLLGRALRLVESLASAEPRLADAHEALEQAAAALGDARHSLQSGEERFESDPERLTEISRRLDQWENLARKHRCAAADLAEHWQSLQLRLNQAENEDGERSRLQAAIAADQQQCAERAATLSQARSAAAAELAKQTLARLPALGLEHARLELALRSDAEQLGPEGQDSVHILVSLNPGQPLQPLAKVASGGELARISLALAVSCRARAEVPILLFDEVDVGVGGAIAEAIGEHLLALAADNQVLCVTHQPQVAALARAHLLVRKEVRDGATYSQISPLSEDARVEELSRMAGGRAITEQTRAHARALLASRPALAK